MIPFQQLTTDSQVLITTFPFWVPATKDPDKESIDQIKQNHGKFLRLPELTKNKLSSEKTSKIIQQIGRVYGLELLQLADISRTIRSYYFGELKLEDFAFVLSREMNINLTRAKQIFQIIKEQIIDDRSYEIALQAELTNLPLSEALRIYPDIGEQLITSQKISLRNFPYPVRPSIKNWLADYTFNLGYEKHESMERSNYLFQGVNTKNLPSLEKQKLAHLLKSFDENSPITVNKKTIQIIFPAITPADRPANGINPSRISSAQIRPVSEPQIEQKNINAMEFSYRQKLPYEKTLPAPASIKSLPSEIPARSRGAERISRGEPQNLPKNVVDLKNTQG